MSDPRGGVRHVNARVKRDTFHHDATIVYDNTLPGNSAQVGLAVTKIGEAESTVSLVGDNERVTGRLEIVESDGKCTVTTQGVVELPAGSAAAVTDGYPIVGALGASSAEGYIKASGVGSDAVVSSSRGEILDATDTTAVQVDLY